jgi:putative flippase GtrA
VLPTALRARLTQIVNFGLVGGLAFVVDVGIYNLLRATVLDDKPIGAKVVSVAIATVVAWMGNRHLTFRAERSRPVLREGILFAVMNVIGLLIAAACLFVSHYLLGFTSQLADNIAGNGVGLVLGMVFRFAAYRYIVFRPPQHSALQHLDPQHLAPQHLDSQPLPARS